MSIRDRKYDDDVKYAVACARIDRKMSYTDIVEALAAGELDPEIPPVEMNPNSLSKYVQQEKQRRARNDLHPSSETSPHELAPDITKRLLSPVLRRLEQYEDEESRGKLTFDESVNRARMIASAFNAISKTTPRPSKPKATKDNGERKPTQEDTMARIARKREQESANKAEGRVHSLDARRPGHMPTHAESPDQPATVAQTVTS